MYRSIRYPGGRVVSQAAGNTVWVEDPLFSSDELSEAGFSSIKEFEANQAKKQEDQGVDPVVLDRKKALDIK